jgi:hypothetical protein
MEARSEDRMEATAGTSFALENGSPEGEQRDAEDEQETEQHKKPAPPKPAPRPTKAEIRRDEQARKYEAPSKRVASHRQKPQAQGEPQGNTYASPGGEHGDE